MLVYHITNIKNLKSILDCGYLYSDSFVIKKDIEHINIAHNNIKDRRLESNILLNNNDVGVVADYVPFYFCTRSPMLYAIHTNYVSTYTGTQEDIIYLCFEVNALISYAGTGWCYSDGNAADKLTHFFNDIEITRIDLNMVNAQYWRNTDEDNDRKRRKQAELLIHDKVSINLIKDICVYNVETQDTVKDILSKNKLKYNTRIEKAWYY